MDVEEQNSDKLLWKLTVGYMCLVPFIIVIMIVNAIIGNPSVLFIFAAILNLLNMIVIWVNG